MGVGGIAIQGTGGIVGIADPLDVMSYADYVYIYIYTYVCTCVQSLNEPRAHLH